MSCRFYQMRKFAKRNRPIVASAAVVFAVLAVASVVSTTLAVRESRVRRAEQEQRALAESARDEAEAVSAFLRNMIGAANPWSVEAGSAIGREIKVVDGFGLSDLQLLLERGFLERHVGMGLQESKDVVSRPR